MDRQRKPVRCARTVVDLARGLDLFGRQAVGVLTDGAERGDRIERAATRVGDHTIFVNGATLAGHVTVEDHAQIGAFCPVHQFCRIGKYAYIAAHTVITQDVPPFSKIVAPRGTRCYGVNSVGLERGGFSAARVEAIEKAYRLLLRSKLNTTQALEKMRGTLSHSEDVLTLIRFVESAERGLTK